MKIVILLALFVACAYGLAPLLHTESETAIPGSYIIVLHQNSSSFALMKTIKVASERLMDMHVPHTFDMEGFKGFSIHNVGDDHVAYFRNHPEVAFVEANQVYTASACPARSGTNCGSWGIARCAYTTNAESGNHATCMNKAGGGTGVTAYIIDTGCIQHTDYSGRMVWGTNTIDSSNTDGNGHGTHVAGTVGGTQYGVAKSVAMVAVKCLNAAGSGTTDSVVGSVSWVTNNAKKPAVANMSLGGGASTAMDNAVAASISAGIHYSIAAGNSNANACNSSPARVSTSTCVGSTESNDNRSSFSNWGNCVHIFAPGTGITSTWMNGGTNTISGTSMACPHVCGAAALILQNNPTWTPLQVRNELVADSKATVGNPGTGSPNAMLYTDCPNWP